MLSPSTIANILQTKVVSRGVTRRDQAAREGRFSRTKREQRAIKHHEENPPGSIS